MVEFGFDVRKSNRSVAFEFPFEVLWPFTSVLPAS